MIKPIEVANGIFRGQSPTSHEDWSVLDNLGIKYILDLQTGASLLGDGSPLIEALHAEGRGMQSYAHPLGEILPPTLLELFCAFSLLMSKPSIYIHCKTGVDRTGMVCAYFRRRTGWSRKEAITEMKNLGMHWWYYWWTWNFK